MSFLQEFLETIQQGLNGANAPTSGILASLLMSAVISLYIYVLYRLLTASTFYQRDFNVALGVIGVVIAAVVLAMQSSLLVSMGMVGALSIVRFRTAVKNTKDLLFLFWSISEGIICGCGLYKLAVISSLFITLLLLAFQYAPASRPPYLAVVNASGGAARQAIISCIARYSPRYSVKSAMLSAGRLEMIVQLRKKEGPKLLDELSAIETVESASLLNHDGEFNI